MADLPKLRTKEQIIGDLLDGFEARVSIGNIDLNKGSVITQFLEANGQQNFRAYADIIAMVDALSVDRAVGEALQRQARDKNVPILAATYANGTVAVTDTTFTKMTSTVFSGQPAPVAGTLTIYVSDASKFPSTGTIYIGRGTTNVEGPLSYTTITPQGGGAYWSITLDGTSPTTKFHNVSEIVTLGQGGDRIVPSGTIVQTAQGAGVTSVSFLTTAAGIILDGEVTVSEIPVISQTVGTMGNVSKGAIRDVLGLPYEAIVTNDKPFSSGRNADTDDDIRDRIKSYEQAKSKGTEVAIKVASTDVVAQDELKKVASSSVARYSDNSAALVFDDGTGYEPLFVGGTYEIVIDSAVGGERELQLRRKPIAQSRIISSLSSPYNIVDNANLTIEIAGEDKTHQFKAEDFKVLGAATALEIMASINGNSLNHFLAATTGGGKKVVLYPKDRLLNDIKVKDSTGDNANAVLSFPQVQEQTIRLYKNDIPLHQDGVTAKVSSRLKSTWSSSITTGDTLQYKVDNTPGFTVTFTNANFQAHDISSTVSSLSNIDLWALVFNDLMPGVNAVVNGEVIDFISNRDNSNSARIEITGGTLRNKIFNTALSLDSEGVSPDFTLNKQTSQISLVEPLLAGDKITAGSQFTRAKVLTASIPSGAAASGKVWMIVDGSTDTIATDIQANTQVKFTKAGTELTITAQSPLLVPEGFGSVQAGDWLLVWSKPTDNAELIASAGFWRVKSAQVGQLIVDDTTTPANAGTFITINQDRIVVARSLAPLQLLDFVSGSLSNLASQIESKIAGVDADIVGGSIRISTKTYDSYGQIYIMAADLGGAALDLPIGEIVDNVPSHFGFITTLDSEAGMPSFTHGILGAAINDTTFSEPNYEILKGNKYDFVQMLNKYNTSTISTVADSNAGRRSFATYFDATLNQLSMVVPPYMKVNKSIMQAGDRYFLRSAYQFDSRDTATVIADGDSVTKSYVMPVARKLIVSSHSAPTTQAFSADDAESSLDLKDPSSFYDFSFDDFRVHRQAQEILNDGVYSVRFKANDFGLVGNSQRIGFIYPSSIEDDTLSHSLSNSELIDINIIIPVKTIRTPSWDYTTAWTAAVSNTGGKETIVFTYRVGTQPDLSTLLSDVQVGDIAIISDSSYFLAGNKGFRAKVTAVSPLSFTVEKPINAAVSDSLSFSNIVNQSGTITVTTATSHSVTTGQLVGLWNTSSHDGLTYPFNTTYTANVTSPTSFTVPTPVAVPGGTIVSSQIVDNVAKIITTAPHNLSIGNIVLVSGAGAAFDGKYAVLSIPSINEFKYIKFNVNTASTGGRFDYQSLGALAPVAITTISRTGYLVTVDTGAAHGLAISDVVRVQSVDIDDYVGATAYNVGDVVEYLAIKYVSLVAANLGNQPDISPASWAVTTKDLTGYFIVNTTPSATQFTYYYDQGAGVTTGTLGTSTEYSPLGSLARCLGGTIDENLAFVEASTTAQEVVDYVSTGMVDIVTAQLLSVPSAVIDTSTEDNDILTNYLDGNIDQLKTIVASRLIKVRADLDVKAGADITISGLAGGLAVYNDKYAVLQTKQLSLTEWELTLQSDVFAAATTTNAVAVIFKGSVPALTFKDGDNSVDITDLDALLALPMFICKETWVYAPTVDEELRLVAVTADHLTRFWNKLVVSGLSNVGTIDNSEYGRQIQLSSQKFGSLGSIQITSDSANDLIIALVGSGSELAGKVGKFEIPYVLRKGLNNGQWVNIKNQLSQNKSLGFDTTTVLNVYDGAPQLHGIEITAGSGTFQVQRSTTQVGTTQIRVEKQGSFIAIMSVAGTSFGLTTAGVKEGDWVRIKNILEAAWVISTVYAIGNRVSYNGLNYTSLTAGNTGNAPDISTTNWRLEEFNAANQGIYQVVRVFGEDTFWIESPNAVEEQFLLGNTNSIKFYSYDSVMPGDRLRIDTNLLGANNVGVFLVVDESAGSGYSFPTSTRIWTEAIPDEQTAVSLGGDFGRVNIEEANPISIWKRVMALGPTAGSNLAVLTDSPELMNKIGSSLGSYFVAQGKLGFDTSVSFGVDAYKYYRGLIAQLNKVIYGDPANPTVYAGIRAAGTDIDIKAAILKRIKCGLAIRIRTGVPFSEVRERVKGAVAGYVNKLGVGVQVSISTIISAAGSVNGVISVAVTSPTYDAANDLIAISADEKAFIIDPTADVIVSILGT